MLKHWTLVLLGDFSEERRVIDPLASQFECRIESAPDLRRVAELCGSLRVCAVLVKTSEDGICLHAVRTAIEWHGVPIVACFGFHDAPTERELDSCYHTLQLPLNHVEFRQCLGFLSQALRSRYSTERLPVSPRERSGNEWPATSASLSGHSRRDGGNFVS